MWIQKKFFSIFYFFLRNDIIWNILETNLKNKILEINLQKNTQREDYKNIDLFGKIRQEDGERWDTFDFKNFRSKNKDKSRDLIFLYNNLKLYNPSKILEVGCGPGLFSRAIYDFNSTKELTLNDINKNFLDYIYEKHKVSKNKKKINFHSGSILNLQINEKNKFDMIIFCRSLHHIPNRMEIFNHLEKLLKENGTIVICEPSNYFFRYYFLLRIRLLACFSNKFLSNKLNFATHHMCSYGEFKKLDKNIKNLKLINIIYNQDNNFEILFLRRIFSKLIFAVFLKKTKN